MTNIAVLGFGVVGTGVVEVISSGAINNKALVCVKKILDIRDFPDSEYNNIITKDYENIIGDDEISIVVETIGGINPAYDFTKQALSKGKYVVTSNKELVATHGTELMELARENNVCYMFEASVGGGIPIIRPLVQCLTADEITEIMGILNGTTNYILTQMVNHDKTFAVALSEAQAKGYAESNPTADVEGHDTCRKIAILSSLCYGRQIDYKEIPTKGITELTLDDIKDANAKGCVIKLVGKSVKNVDGSITAEVSPMVLPKEHPLAGIEDVFNGILVKGSVTGEVMFYGRGAGKLPTASAVVADIADIVINGNKNAPTWK